MMMSHNDTKRFIQLVLKSKIEEARGNLYVALRAENRNEGQFYDGIVKHVQGMGLTTDEWYELLIRLPNRFLRSGLALQKILSEE